ncbi:MAG: membrane protein required for beta-lactamase induction [Paracoccaceae bacterium]|jgi:membrane protein required for beta-lactamase induction
MGSWKVTRRHFLIVAILVALSATVFYKANPITNAAQRYAISVAAACAGVYITLRSLNAFLSTAQEIEIGGALIVSGTAQPLKMLEPIDDTIERVASLVFFLMVTTGIMAVAMGPVGAVGYAMILLAMVLALATPSTAQGKAVAELARRLGWYGAFLGLALPLAFVLSSLVADRLTNEVWTSHMAVIDDITAQVQTAEITAQKDGEGWFSSLKFAADELDRYMELAKNIVDHADDLIASLVAILAVFVESVRSSVYD